MHIIWNKRAEKDLYLSISYIAKESPKNAGKVLKKIIALSKGLALYPLKYPKDPIYNNERVRFAIIYSFKLIYKIESDKIRIPRLFHTKQHPSKA